MEPARTPYDLHFRVLGIPVRINPWFWLAAFILGYLSAGGGQNPTGVLIFMGVMFVSILVHELGHALLMRRFGYEPRIVLYQFGGLAIRDEGFSGGFTRRPRRGESRQSILISLAGPGAGFLLAGITIVLILAAQGTFSFAPSFPQFWEFEVPRVPKYSPMWSLIEFTLFVNIFWGLMNLLPILPLDGGQVAREMLAIRDPQQGLVQALQLSIGVGIVVALFLFLSQRDSFGAIMFGGLALSNYMALQQVGRMQW